MRSVEKIASRSAIARVRSVAWFSLLLVFTAADGGCQVTTTDSTTPRQTRTLSPHGTKPKSTASQPTLSDIDHFIERREACDHFRGEDPYDGARRAFLKRKMSKTCNGTDAELHQLRWKYRDKPDVVQRLFVFDDQIE
jgi:hypothetical protein